MFRLMSKIIAHEMIFWFPKTAIFFGEMWCLDRFCERLDSLQMQQFKDAAGKGRRILNTVKYLRWNVLCNESKELNCFA